MLDWCLPATRRPGGRKQSLERLAVVTRASTVRSHERTTGSASTGIATERRTLREVRGTRLSADPVGRSLLPPEAHRARRTSGRSTVALSLRSTPKGRSNYSVSSDPTNLASPARLVNHISQYEMVAVGMRMSPKTFTEVPSFSALATDHY